MQRMLTLLIFNCGSSSSSSELFFTSSVLRSREEKFDDTVEGLDRRTFRFRNRSLVVIVGLLSFL